ncbi:MAG TPA: Type 1 glutamine amidotransferase-like domain-containing protein [Acidimicrobiales bacterium]|nr:Type 1 glutamine amidotransferase-like domain-containing protein [Acidimicrobiales bacterium]
MRGPLGLVGSGEFLQVMTEVDRHLLEGRPRRAVFLPTAAGQEGDERVDYWLDLGRRHYERLGVEAVPLRVLDRSDAEREELAAEIAGAGLVYLSGGSPAYLADTLRDTAVWRAILDAHEAGAALAGCSAGACALTRVAGGFRERSTAARPGLAVVAHLAVIPHFDRFDGRDPGLAAQFAGRVPPGVGIVGVDEETALVGGPEHYTVMGRRSAWWLRRDGSRSEWKSGSSVFLPVGCEPVIEA